jgi:hypothetical protein
LFAQSGVVKHFFCPGFVAALTIAALWAGRPLHFACSGAASDATLLQKLIEITVDRG